MSDDLLQRLQHVGLRPDRYARRPHDLAQVAGEAVGEIERLRRELANAQRSTASGWVDRHEVVVPPPCSLDRAFDGESEAQRRELHPLERDVLCRLLDDVLHRVLTLSTTSLVWEPIPGLPPGFVRLEVWEVPLLLNLVEVLQPRSEANW